MELFIHPLVARHASDKYLIYRPLIGLAFVGNQAMAKICQGIADGTIEMDSLAAKVQTFLQTIGFLSPDPAIPSLPKDDEFSPTMAVLLMTNRCQLRCVYCYAAAGESPPQDLPLEIGKTAIDIVHENAQQKGLTVFDVSFHGGGEPTLVWKTMQACTEYARKKPLQARVTLTSNGIWSKSQGEWITSNLDGLSLSMDGRPESQNRQRPFARRGDSFPIVWRNIMDLDRKNFEYGIRLTATPPWENLPKDIEFLCKETGCKRFQVEPTFHILRGSHGDPQRGDGQPFVDAFLLALEIAEESGRELMYSGARLGHINYTFCTAPYGALIVNGKGEVVSCYELAGAQHPMERISVFGTIRPGALELDLPVRKRLLALLKRRRESCRDCFCYWSCAGDCYVRALPGPQTEPAYRGERCVINRTLTVSLILKEIASNGGVWKLPYLDSRFQICRKKGEIKNVLL